MRLGVGGLTRLSTWATALLAALGFVFHLSVDNSARGFPCVVGDILVRYIIRSANIGNAEEQVADAIGHTWASYGTLQTLPNFGVAVDKRW